MHSYFPVLVLHSAFVALHAFCHDLVGASLDMLLFHLFFNDVLRIAPSVEQVAVFSVLYLCILAMRSCGTVRVLCIGL